MWTLWHPVLSPASMASSPLSLGLVIWEVSIALPIFLQGEGCSGALGFCRDRGVLTGRGGGEAGLGGAGRN